MAKLAVWLLTGAKKTGPGKGSGPELYQMLGKAILPLEVVVQNGKS